MEERLFVYICMKLTTKHSQINSSNPLATLYNDRSVLESLHSMTLFQLLNKHGIDRLIGDSKSDAYKGALTSMFVCLCSTEHKQTNKQNASHAQLY